MTTSEYINQYAQTAIDSSKNYGIFPSVTMAQSILESSWGNSELANNGNNFFGIKNLGNWNGETYTIGSNVYRKYNSDLESFLDHTIFLQENSRYKNAFNADSPEEQIEIIHDAGYAEDPLYTSKIISLINDYDLKQLDKMDTQNNYEGDIANLPEIMVIATPFNATEIAAIIILLICLILLFY